VYPTALPARTRPESAGLTAIRGASDIEPSDCTVNRAGCGVPGLPCEVLPATCSEKYPHSGGPGPGCTWEWIPCAVFRIPCAVLRRELRVLPVACTLALVSCVILTQDSGAVETARGALSGGCPVHRPGGPVKAPPSVLIRVSCGVRLLPSALLRVPCGAALTPCGAPRTPFPVSALEAAGQTRTAAAGRW
jgi:hypothetical protein